MHVQHVENVIHIKNNMCDNYIWMLLDIPKKTKVGLLCRLDLKQPGIIFELASKQKYEKVYLSSTMYNLTNKVKDIICGFLPSSFILILF